MWKREWSKFQVDKLWVGRLAWFGFCSLESIALKSRVLPRCSLSLLNEFLSKGVPSDAGGLIPRSNGQVISTIGSRMDITITS